jgi:hypothetical protein
MKRYEKQHRIVGLNYSTISVRPIVTRRMNELRTLKREPLRDDFTYQCYWIIITVLLIH